jgi:alcohol dehydrogenase class IV
MMTTNNAHVNYQIIVPQSVSFGVGTLDALGTEVKKMKAQKVLVVAGPNVFRSGLVQPIKEQLSKAMVSTDIFAEAEREPTLLGLNKAAGKLKNSQYDVIIGVGGGSSIDTAKGLSVLLAHGGKGQDYLGTDKIPRTDIAIIAIPTTAGTGSEVTNIAIFSDTEKELKVGMVSPYILPRMALVDPVLTYDCPPGITASSGIDAMVHAIECYTSRKANSFTDALAVKALQLIYGSLKTAVSDGSDQNARNAMSEGALLAGIAFGNAGVAAVHALAYPLGARFHVSHGMANGLLLPHVMECNISANPTKYAFIAEVLGESVKGLTPVQAAGRGISAVKKLIKDIGIPQRLRDLEVPKKALDGMAAATMDVTRLLANNPKTLTLDDVRNIWENAW